MVNHKYKSCGIIPYNMVKKEGKRPALSGFRLPTRAVDNLEYLINHGYFRNKTEAVVVAIEHITTEYKTRETITKEDKNE